MDKHARSITLAPNERVVAMQRDWSARGKAYTVRDRHCSWLLLTQRLPLIADFINESVARDACFLIHSWMRTRCSYRIVQVLYNVVHNYKVKTQRVFSFFEHTSHAIHDPSLIVGASLRHLSVTQVRLVQGFAPRYHWTWTRLSFVEKKDRPPPSGT